MICIQGIIQDQITCSGAGKQLSVCEAQLWGVKFMMVWSISLHQVPWIESEPVKKSKHKQADVKILL
jgi:hypothetical protein